MDLQRELGLSMPSHRYSDDDDMVEAALLRSLDRWGDRMVPHKDESERTHQYQQVYYWEPKVRRRLRYQKAILSESL